MGLLKHATVEGINAGLEHAGIVAWPNEKIASEVCHGISTKLGGDEELQNGLSSKTAMEIARLIKAANEQAIAKGMQVDVALHRKTASERNYVERAYEVAASCMQKAAEETASLTNVGPNTPESAAASNDVAALDQKNRATGEYLVGVGSSDMPTGGAIGKEMPAMSQPGRGTAGDNSVVDQSKVSHAFDSKGLTDAKIAQLIVHGATPKIREAALKLANLKKTAAEKTATSEQLVSSLVARVMAPKRSKTADDVADLVAALQAAGIDPSQISEEELMMALQALQQGGGGGGMPPGAGGEGGEGEEPPPGPPEKTSAEAQTLSILRKLAEGGSLNETGPNTPESAAKSNDVAKLDQENRSTTEYTVDQGKSEMPNVGQVYGVQPAPKAPTTAPDTTASRETKTSSLSEEEQAYLASITKVAEKYTPQLPAAMPRDEKVAHLKTLLATPPSERDAYVKKLASAK